MSHEIRFILTWAIPTVVGFVLTLAGIVTTRWELVAVGAATLMLTGSVNSILFFRERTRD